MSKTLTILALIGFTAMAVFSFLGMGMNEHTGYHGRCLAELASNTACPPGSGPVGASLFHLNAFKTFSTGLIGATVFGLIVLFALTLLSLPVSQPVPSIPTSYLNQTDSPPPADPHITNWLARLQNSPSNTDHRFRLSRND